MAKAAVGAVVVTGTTGQAQAPCEHAARNAAFSVITLSVVRPPGQKTLWGAHDNSQASAPLAYRLLQPVFAVCSIQLQIRRHVCSDQLLPA